MRRVKLMLDPTGSAKGKDLPPGDLDLMNEQQRQEYEAEQIMRGMGNKCLKKALESLLFSAVTCAILYQTGALEYAFRKLNP